LKSVALLPGGIAVIGSQTGAGADNVHEPAQNSLLVAGEGLGGIEQQNSESLIAVDVFIENGQKKGQSFSAGRAGDQQGVDVARNRFKGLDLMFIEPINAVSLKHIGEGSMKRPGEATPDAFTGLHGEM
jgi:hypothetical protein